jgi:DNA-directed RNA polymerase subunit RPC12/RpoP
MTDDYAEEEMEEEEIEAYCVSCKAKVPMESPTAVYTRRGAPGTRGRCPDCGSTVFRMGRTAAHGDLPKPKIAATRPDSVAPKRKTKRSALSQTVAYINYAADDSEFAHRLAEDLEKMGIPSWVDFDENADDIVWAGGAHPAFDECDVMVVVLSGEPEEQVRDTWEVFRSRKKPLFVAQLGKIDVPDELRTRPRYDFNDNYKTAFRQLVQVLMKG